VLLALLALKHMARLALEGCLCVGDTFRSPSSSIVSLLFFHLRAGDIGWAVGAAGPNHLKLEGCRASVNTKYFLQYQPLFRVIIHLTGDVGRAVGAAGPRAAGAPQPWRAASALETLEKLLQYHFSHNSFCIRGR